MRLSVLILISLTLLLNIPGRYCIAEKSKEEKFDVLVYGATPSGLAAAISAARMGMKVALVDESGRLSSESFFNDPPTSLRLLQPFYKEIWGRNTNPIVDSTKFWAETGLSIVDEILNHEPILHFFEGWKWDGEPIHQHGQILKSLHLVRIKNIKRGKNISAQIFVDASQKGELAKRLGAKFASLDGYAYLDPEAELLNSLFCQQYPRILGNHLLNEAEGPIDPPRPTPDEQTIGVAQPNVGKATGYSTTLYCIPFGVMVPINSNPVLVTQCLAATWGIFWDLQTVSAQFTLGHTAGVAAALCVRLKSTPSQLNIDSIQTQLIRQKALLVYVADVLPEHPDFEWVQKMAIHGWISEDKARLDDKMSPEDIRHIATRTGFSEKEVTEMSESKSDRRTALYIIWKAFEKEKWRNDPKANPKQLKD